MNRQTILSPLDAALWAVFGLVLTFLFLPLVVVIPISFTPGTVIQFPPDGLSLRWYRDALEDERWRQALWVSVRLGISVAVVTTVLGLGAALALTRFVSHGKTFIRTLVLAPLIVPVIITSIAVFDIFTRTGLARTFLGLVIAHTIIAVPFAVIILESALRRFDVSLEEAAISLGASPLGAFCRITLPILAPALLASLVFSFVTSWDEVVLVVFLGGATNQTLPLRMFEFLESNIRPTVAAISTALILATIGGILAYYSSTTAVGMLRRWRATQVRRELQWEKTDTTHATKTGRNQ
ncbi:MAG: ABC transporter permease [Dehalococcoidia bacterium]